MLFNDTVYICLIRFNNMYTSLIHICMLLKIYVVHAIYVV